MSAMGIPVLIHAITSAATEQAAAAFYVFRERCKCLAALNTSSIHGASIAHKDAHVQPVYDIEVEDDHSFVANGLVVHNCMACVAMHGSEHGLDETLDDHVNGRCVAAPITVNPRDIGIDIDWEQEKPETGEAWFNRQSEADQRAMMGPGKYEAWTNGEIEIPQLAKEVQDARWGRSIVEMPLKELIDTAD